MKRLTLMRGFVVCLALGLVVMVPGIQQAGADDPGTGSGERLVIAARRVTTQAVVPSLIGKDKAQTEKALAEAGLELGTVQFTTSAKGKPGTVVQQKPRAKTTVAKESAVNVVVLLRAAATVSPKIVQRGEKVFMEFPNTVKDVTISDQKGNKLQQFNTGRRFEITESAVVTKAGRITVKWKSPPPDNVYAPWDPPDGPPLDMDYMDHIADLGLSQYVRVELKSPAERLAKQSQVEVDERFLPDTSSIDNKEPENNTIDGATYFTSQGFYAGKVGGDDAADYIVFADQNTSLPEIVHIQVFSGDVKLTLYDHEKNMVVPMADKVWIAVRNADCYISIKSTSGETAHYTISIITKIINNYILENTCSLGYASLDKYRLINLNTPVYDCLCSVMSHLGIANLIIEPGDWFSFTFPPYLPYFTRYKIRADNLGLPATLTDDLLCNNVNCNIVSDSRGAGYAELILDMLPSFSLQPTTPTVFFSVKPTGEAPLPYGIGTEPANYLPYVITVEKIPQP
jgi:hypothetical protein